MANAQRELGFQVIEYRPGRPWEKDPIEHLFSVLVMQIVDRRPGVTSHSPDERKKFEAEAEKAKPVLSISALRDWLTYLWGKLELAQYEGFARVGTIGRKFRSYLRAKVGRTLAQAAEELKLPVKGLRSFIKAVDLLPNAKWNRDAHSIDERDLRQVEGLDRRLDQPATDPRYHRDFWNRVQEIGEGWLHQRVSERADGG
jgi:hypothetical protein